MERVPSPARRDWQRRVEQLGFDFHTIDGEPYWVEDVCYRFSSAQVDHLEAVTNELHRVCLAAVGHVIQERRLDEFGIPGCWHGLVERSWRQREADIYGRFDLAWDGRGEPKMLEYNADTPTSLFEAAVVQWFWLRDCRPEADQFNSIHERLIAAWRGVRERPGSPRVAHFASVRDSDEDRITCEYMRDVCTQAGFHTEHLDVGEIGWNGREYTDLSERGIRLLFKLYPWEWLIREPFGAWLVQAPTRWVEPPWKMVLSNKAILPVLWELFPDHPNLLPSFRDPGPLGRSWVRKPLLGREGANVMLRCGDEVIESVGGYGEEGYVWQAHHPLPCFDGWYPVIGSWVVAGEAAGIGIREDAQPITGNLSRFIPHYFR